MQALGAWVAFPLAFAALAWGWGLLVEAASGRELPGALLPGAGFAALIVALALPGFLDATAPAALWIGTAGAVLGWVVRLAGAGPRSAWPRPSWGAVAAGGAFAAYMATTVLSGHPGVAGYIRLDDSATWIVLGDHVLRHGYDLSGLPPSSHDSALGAYLPGHYPVGAFLPLAATGRLVGTDLAWAYTSYLACAAALLALGLYDLAGRVIDARPARAGAAVLAACSGMLFGYVGWGGIKEIVAASLIAVLAALAPGALAVEPGARPVRVLRGLLPLGLACAALMSALSIGAVVWIGAVLAPAAVVAVRRLGPLIAGGIALAVAAVAAAGSVVALGDAEFLRSITTKPTDPAEQLGNLLEPLSPLQILGIWPAGDFRLHPPASGATTILLLILAACAITGIWAAARRGAWPVLGYAIGVLVAAAFVAWRSDPWIDAKALAVASPAPVLLACAGIASLERELGRAVTVMLAILVGGGVIWTDALAYHDATLTPHARHQELADIGERFSDRRPALMTEYDPWGARWFLRRMEGEGASELRYRVVPLLDGSQTPKATTADIDRYQLGGLLAYQALVLRRSPVASRPPSAFRLAWTGRYYEVWLRRPGAPAILSHQPLEGASASGTRATCAQARAMAQTATPGGHLVASPSRQAWQASLDVQDRPAGWASAGTGTGAVIPDGAGRITTSVDLPRGGRFDVWLGGAVKPPTTIAVDGRVVARLVRDLQYGGQWLPAGRIALTAGTHVVTVSVAGGGLRPAVGHAHDQFSIGPVAFSRPGARDALVRAGAGSWRTLCRAPLDWIEAVRP